MRVLICGDRNWTNGNRIFKTLMQFHKEKPVTVVIEGEAPGADTLARRAAEELGICVMAFPANWNHFKRAAGPIRNQWMLNFGKPDLVLAFHSDIENSKGTKDMVNRAKKAGVKVRVIK